MSVAKKITVRQVVDTVAFLCREGESDHYGKGVTRDRVVEEFDVVPSTVQRYLRRAEQQGKLESRPAVRPGQTGTMLAYTPVE